jgi:hypothetical protein
MKSLWYFETSVTSVTMTQYNVPEGLKPRHVNNWIIVSCLLAQTRNIAVLYNQLAFCGATHRHTEWAVGRLPLKVILTPQPSSLTTITSSGAAPLPPPPTKSSNHVQAQLYLRSYEVYSFLFRDQYGLYHMVLTNRDTHIHVTTVRPIKHLSDAISTRNT